MTNGREVIGGGTGSKSVEEWRQGWTLVFTSMLGFAVAQLYSYTLGTLIEPLQQEFGWTRAQITTGMVISSLMTFSLSPIIGRLVDRFGSRHIGLLGMVGFLGAFAMFSTIGPSIWSWWLAWVLLATFSASLKPPIWSRAISSRFFRERALALALLFCGAGIGSSTMPILTTLLIGEYGWRGAYIGLAIIGGAVALPLMWFFLYDARDRPLRDAAAGDQPASTAFETGLGIREAILSSRFFRLAIVGMMMSGLAVSLTVHFVPILTGSGFTRTAAAATTSLLGVGSITGRIVTGYFLDRFNGPMIGMISFLVPVPVIYFLTTLDGSPATAGVAALLLGLSIGAESDILVYLSTRYFGLRNFGTIYGGIIGVTALGSSGAAILGHVHDVTGTYHGALRGMIPIYLLSAAMVGTLGGYPQFQRPAEADNNG